MPVIKPSDEATNRYNIASDPKMISNWANLANSLGYGWCGGTASQYVGNDFSVSAVSGDSTKYSINANYRDSDPHKDGYRSNERLKMTMSNFTVQIDPNTITYGSPVITSLNPIDVGTYYVVNSGSSPVVMTKGFNTQLTSSVTHTTTYSFTEGFSLKQKWNAGIPGLGAQETEFTFNFSATQGWSDASTTTNLTSETEQVQVQVPPKSKVPITLVAARTQSNVSYTATATYGYSIELNNFLAYTWNARVDHPQDRPYQRFTFGTDRLNAIEHLVDLYDHRGISGYNTKWDWQSALTRHSELDALITSMKTDLPTIPFTGNFQNVYGSSVTYKVGDAIPLVSSDNIENTNSSRLLSMSSSTSSEAKEMNVDHAAVRGVSVASLGMFGHSAKAMAAYHGGLTVQRDEEGVRASYFN